MALKRLHRHSPADTNAWARFKREQRLAAQLRGKPHIIPIHEFGEINGQLFIDMRLVDGKNLATVSGGLSVVFGAARELYPWRREQAVHDVQDRLLVLVVRT